MTTMLPRMTPATGLGYATPSAKAWIHGGSPTKGFLSSIDVGPFQGTFHTQLVGSSGSAAVGQMRTYPSAGYAHAVSC